MVAAILTAIMIFHAVIPAANAALPTGIPGVGVSSDLNLNKGEFTFTRNYVDSMRPPKVVLALLDNGTEMRVDKGLVKIGEETNESGQPEAIIKVPLETQSTQKDVTDSVYRETETIKIAELETKSITGEIIVRYKDNANTKGPMGLMGDLGQRDNLQLVQVIEGEDIDEILEELEKDPNVEYAEPNYKLYSQETLMPNDPLFEEQRGMDGIEIVDAWDYADYLLDGESAEPVTVAVIDTGVDSTHEDLSGRVLSGYNAISDGLDTDDVAYSMDDSSNGHGTHIAGIIAAKTNNEKGIAGVAGEFPVSILPVKVLDSAGVGTMYDVAQGIYWAADNGAKIINLSLGARLPDYPRTLAEAVRYAQEKGILVIAAAGNDGMGVADFYPAFLPGVLSVGAIDTNMRKASFSNDGDVAAPGVNILSTTTTKEGYDSLSGTSQSAGFVSGIAALLRSVFPEKGVIEVAQSIMEGLTNSGFNSYVSAYNALQKLQSGTNPYHGIQIVSPDSDKPVRVSGDVELTVRLLNPVETSRVEFFINSEKTGDFQLLVKITEIDKESGLITYEWDTTTMLDGMYYIDVISYDLENSRVGYAYFDVIIANVQETGFVIEIEKPDGKPASGAWVTVQHYPYIDPYTERYEELWNGPADIDGKIIISGSEAIAGNDFLITAQGTEPNFFYYKVVHSPEYVKLDASDAETMTVTCIPQDKGPLARAQVYFEMLEANLPDCAEPLRPLVLGYRGNYMQLVPLAILDAEGTAELTLTHGRYNLGLLSNEFHYNLLHKDVAIVDGKTTFDFLSSGTATIRLSPDGQFSSYAINLLDENRNKFRGFERIEGEQLVTVSPGTYSAEIEAICSDYESSKEMVWTLGVPAFEVKAKEDKSIAFGGYIQAEIQNNPKDQEYWEQGWFAYFDTCFTDAYGNLTLILREGTNQEIFPTLYVRNEAGEEIGYKIVTFKEFDDDYSTDWFIPNVIPEGEDSTRLFVWAELDAGILAPTGNDGKVKSSELEIQVKKPVYLPPDDEYELDIEIFDLAGNPTGGIVRLFKKQPSGEYEENYDFEPGEYLVTFYGESIDPENPDESPLPVFMFREFIFNNESITITLDASELNMEKITIEALDEKGVSLTLMGNNDSPYIHYYIYPCDSNEVLAGMWLGRFNPYRQDEFKPTLWVPKGEYLFRAVVPSWDYDKSIYYISERKSIPEDVTEDKKVNIGGTNMQSLSVKIPDDLESYYPPYDIAGVALFDSDYPVPVLKPWPGYDEEIGQLMYVTPGQYTAVAVLIRDHYDGNWNYWLTRELDLRYSNVTWEIDDNIQADFILNDTSFALSETVETFHSFQDGFGNQLAAVAINGIMGFSSTDQEPPAEGQTHTNIAPFLSVSTNDMEIFRYKAEDPEATRGWLAFKPMSQNEPNLVSKPSGQGTFYEGSFTIPEDALGGTYTASLELAAGPDLIIKEESTFDVVAAPFVILDPIPSPTKAVTVVVSGKTLPNALVKVKYTYNGTTVDLDIVTANETGEFIIEDISLDGEGSYTFAAAASLNDLTGEESDPVIVVIDRTAPGKPENLQGEAQDQSHIQLTWSAPSDEDVAGYRIIRDGVLIHEVDKETLQFLDSGLEEGVEYSYEVIAVDRAGNESLASTVKVKTLATGDTVPPTAPGNPRAVAIAGSINIEWDEATDNIKVVGYRIYRSIDGGPEELLAETQELNYTDTGLEAETTYTYTITAIDGANNESPRSSMVTVTTPAISITTLSYSIERDRNGLIMPGQRVIINILGDPGRRAKAEIICPSLIDDEGNVLEDVQDVVKTVDLQEDIRFPGTYRGIFTIPSGITGIKSIKGILEDNSGHSAQREAVFEPIVPTYGNLVVTIEEGYEELKGSRLELWSNKHRSGNAITLSDSGNYYIQGLIPSDDYSLRIIYQERFTIFKLDNVKVTSGVDSSVSITPPRPASLDVKVVEETPSGEKGVEGVAILITGENLGITGISRKDGYAEPTGVSQTEMIPFAPEGYEAEVKAYLNDEKLQRFYIPETTTVKLKPGENEAKILLERRPIGIIEGTVRDQDETPIAGAYITALTTLTTDKARTIIINTRTDKNGKYSFEVPAHEWQITASANSALRQSHTIDVQADQNNYLDFELPFTDVVRIEVYIKMADEPEERPVPEDWRASELYGFLARNITKNKSIQVIKSNYNYIYVTDSEPGDVIEITLNARDASMNNYTSTVTLDKYQSAKAVFHIKEFGGIRASMRDENGNTLRGQERTVEVYRQNGNNLIYEGAVKTDDSTVDIRNLEQGLYTVVYYWGRFTHLSDTHRSMKNGILTSRWWERYNEGIDYVMFQDIEVTDGEITNLGIVALPTDKNTSTGYFAGQEGNGIVSNVTTAAPGRIVTLRGSYRYERDPSKPDPEDVTLYLGIPAGTTLVDKSVVIIPDGELPLPTCSVNTDENRLEIHIGDMVKNQGRAIGTVTYQVKIDDVLTWPTSAVKAWVEFRAGSKTLSETLGLIMLELPYVSISAPKETIFEEIIVNGHAPAGSNVDIFDGNIYLGRATASAYGLWSLKVTLPDNGDPARHLLTAHIAGQGDDEPIISAPAEVVYDTKKPNIVNITMSQLYGRKVTFDPREGVARFPYIYSPIATFHFNIEFSDGRDISDVIVRMDSNELNAVRSDENTFMASGVMKTPGDIYIEYTEEPPGYRPEPLPVDEEGIKAKEKEIRDAMPEEWRFAKVEVGEKEEFSMHAQSSPHTTPPVFISINGNENFQRKVTFGVRELPNYVADPNNQPIKIKGGPTIYDYSLKVDIATDVIEIRAIMPASALEPYMQANGQSFKTQADNVLEIWVIDENPVKGGLGLADLYDTIKSGFEFQDTMDELHAFLDKTSSCSASHSKYYHERAEQLAEQALQNLCIKYGLQLGGIALGATGIGVIGTVAVWGISAILTEVSDARFEQSFKDLKQELADDEDCKREDDNGDGDGDGNNDYDGSRGGRGGRRRRGGGGPSAKPSWIYDPSGYVYEGVPDNRIEGVIATAVYQDGDGWAFWDAEWYEQENPQVTDAQGRYGWDVPKGQWKVVYEKEGYEPLQSWEMQVPPPHMDVNVGIISLDAPKMTGADGATEGSRIDFTFDKYMMVNTLSAPTTVALSVYGEKDDFGNTIYVEGKVEPVNPQKDPKDEDVELARTFSFIPEDPLTIGNSYELFVSQMVHSYAGSTMDEDCITKVIITGQGHQDNTPPGPVTNVKIREDDGKLTVSWKDPLDADLDKIKLELSGNKFGAPVEVNKGVETCEFTGLTNGVTYDISITAVDNSGNKSTSVVVSGTPKKSGGSKPSTRGGDKKETPQVIPSQEQFEVGSGAQTITGFNGEITLEIPEGAFGQGTTITIRKTADRPTQNVFDIYSAIYNMDTGGVTPNKPITLKITYDKTKTQSLDPRKLGIYSRVETANWIYQGGIVDTAEGIAFAVIDGPGAYAVMAANKTFEDLKNHWSRRDIEVLISRDIVKGVSDNQFQPDRSITRAEMTKLLIELLNTAQGKCIQSNVSRTSIFKDVDPNQWYHPYVEAGAKYGIVKGSNGLFRPNDPVTREEMAAMISRTLGLDIDGTANENAYFDKGEISTWAASSISVVSELGLMHGVAQNRFQPRANATRAQAGVVVLRAMEKLGLITKVANPLQTKLPGG